MSEQFPHPNEHQSEQPELKGDLQRETAQENDAVTAESHEENEEKIDSLRKEITALYEANESGEIKEGVDFVFEQNPTLATIGTKEQYSQYLESIFPNSTVKDILYHYSSYEKIKEEGFKFFTELDGAAGAGLVEAIYFTAKKDNYWGKNDLSKYAAIINAEHPLDVRNATSEEDPAVLEYHALMEEGAEKPSHSEGKYETAKNRKLAFTEKGYDTVLAPELEEVVVFDKNHIHILGSQYDVQKFKEFVG